MQWTGVTANQKPAQTSNETTAGTLYAKATYSGKTATANAYVKQGANAVVSTTYTYLHISADMDRVGVAASGGTANPPSSEHITTQATGYTKYTSNATAYTETGPTVTVSWSGNTNIPAKPAQPSNETTASTLTGKAVWSGLTSNTITVYVIQAANAIVSTNYTALTFYLAPPSAIPASGGSVGSTTITDGQLRGYVKYTSNATAITTTDVNVTNPTWGSASTESGTITWNKSVSADTRGTTTGSSRTVGYLCAKATISGASGEQRVEVTQEANRRSTSPTWDSISISMAQPADIPASGGTVNRSTFTCTRNGHWDYTSNATAATSTTVSSGSTSYSFNSVQGDNLEDSVVGREEVGTLTVSVTYGGKSGSDSKPVYQEANSVVGSSNATSNTYVYASSSVTIGNYEVTTNKSSISFSSSGASSTTITVSASHEATTATTSNLYRVSATTTWYTSKYTGVTRTTASTPYSSVTEYETDSVTDTATVSNSNAWITATTFQIKVAAQSAGAGARNGYVYYRNSTASTSVYITQVAGAVTYWILVNGETTYSNSLSLGEDEEIEITCGGGSTSWSASIPYTSRNLIKVNGSSGVTSFSGTNGDRVTITCMSSNPDKTVTITFTCGSGSNKATAYYEMTPTGD